MPVDREEILADTKQPLNSENLRDRSCTQKRNSVYPGWCQSLKIRRKLKIWKRKREGRKEEKEGRKNSLLFPFLVFLFYYFLALVPRVSSVLVCVTVVVSGTAPSQGMDIALRNTMPICLRSARSFVVFSNAWYFGKMSKHIMQVS